MPPWANKTVPASAVRAVCAEFLRCALQLRLLGVPFSEDWSGIAVHLLMLRCISAVLPRVGVSLQNPRQTRTGARSAPQQAGLQRRRDAQRVPGPLLLQSVVACKHRGIHDPCRKGTPYAGAV